MDQWLERLLGDVRAGQPRDLAGSHGAADLAVTEDLLNRLLAEKLPRDGAVKDLSVRLEAGTARVSVKLTRPAFLPAINMRVTVDRQPELPGSPVLSLRLDMPPGMAALAGAALGFLNALPRGHRLEGDRLMIDIATVLGDLGYGWVLPYLRTLRVSIEPGRLVHHVELNAPA